MAKPLQHQTHYTRQAQVLLSKVYGRSKLKDSILERAIHYFNHQSFVATNESVSETHLELEKLERIDRHNHLLNICREIIDLTEGDSFEESNRKSAQLLGTIQLISPVEGKKVATNNEYCKSLYKAILSLRLLDRLLFDNEITAPHIANTLAEFPEKPFAQFDLDAQRRVINQIKIPLLMAALLQDIGLYHSEAQELLIGGDSTKDPHRTLNVDERKKLLTINYKQTLKYITDGLSIPTYVGHSREERDQFVVDEQVKLQFLQQLIKSSFKPKQTVGNLLKVPQIYTSIVFSTKHSYNYKVLPKVYQVLNKSAELGACSQKIVDALYQITGMFPQGYGVIYMPQEGGCYEYAIVNRLYPPLPEQPLCRIATRKLAFIGYGHNIEVKKESNLYFPHMAKKIASLSKERLNEILELLSSNYQERQELDLLPRCWHANEFFSVRTNQKLWNKVD
ncbi:MAG: hypothetical protein QNK36_04480 [Colwellia sp.]|nr:hypothetical protein [Colwellia sp.]